MRFISSNKRGPNTSEDYLRDVLGRAPDVVGIQEPRGLDKKQASRHGYRVHRGKVSRGSTALLTRRRTTKVKGTWERMLARAGRKRSYVQDRRSRMTRLYDEAGNKWFVIVIHLNPGERGLARTRNIIYMARLVPVIMTAKALGYYVAVIGDFNRYAHDRGPDSPHWLAEKCGLQMHMRGIDGGLFSRSLKVSDIRSFKPAGSDHESVEFVVSPA